MDLTQLEIFCGVFKEHSFSRAAEKLGLAQPTISIRIKEFEEELGVPLFNRLGREIEPTDAGRFLYDQAQPLLTQRRALSEKMASFLNRVEGPLIVGTSLAAGEHLLPGIMMDFQTKYPGVHVILRFFSDSIRTMEELRNGDIEIGVTVPTKGRDDVATEPFGEDELVLITPSTGRWKRPSLISLSDLKQLPLIVLTRGSATRASLEQALAVKKTHLQDLKVVAELGRTGAIKQAVKQGYGVAFISKRAAAAELEAGTLRSASVSELGTIVLPVNIIYERRRELSPTARAFLEQLRRSTPPTNKTVSPSNSARFPSRKPSRSSKGR